MTSFFALTGSKLRSCRPCRSRGRFKTLGDLKFGTMALDRLARASLVRQRAKGQVWWIERPTLSPGHRHVRPVSRTSKVPPATSTA